jgi:TP901 family phage tail tape measure protein
MAATRTTRVSLVAEVNSYIAGFERAQNATRQLGSDIERTGQRREAIQSLGTTMFATGAVLAAGVGLAVAKFAEFDQAMSSIQAATHETSSNMALLREAAISAGGATAFSATEAANAIEELAKAGLSTADILDGGLNGALSLAAAGGLAVADAAQQTAIALKQFGLEGSDAGHVADLLAAGAGKAVGDVSDLSAALGQAGLVANGAGQSIEDTTGVLAAFADQGLLGSDAGTSLKSAIIALQAPTDKSRAVMEKYNLSFYDGNGQMLSYSEIAGQLAGKLNGLDDETRNAALAQIFGNDALRAANVLYGQGADGIQKYVDQTNDSGYAAETARIKMDNLKGDIEKLGGSIDTALIQTGSGANESLRNLVSTTTFLVDAIGSMPQPVLGAALAITAVAAGVGLAGGGALLAIPKIIAFKASLDTLGISAGRAAAATVAIGGAIGLAAVAIGYLVGQQANAAATTAELADTLDKATGATTKYTREAIAKKLSDQGIFDIAKKAGVSQKELTDAVLEGGDAYKEVSEKLYELNTAGHVFDGLALQSVIATEKLDGLRQGMEDAPTVFDDLKKASDGATEGMGTTADGLAQVTEAGSAAQDQIDELKSAIEGFGSAQIDVNSATRDFEAAIDGLTGSVAENGATLDVGTAAGRENQAALDGIATSTLALSSATLTQTGSQQAASDAIATGRQRLIEALGALGITGQAAEDYADKLGLIPSNISTLTQVTGIEDVQARLNTFITRNDGRVISIRQQLITDAVANGAAPGAAKAAYANGGQVDGPGPVGRDSVVAMLAPGEHVWTAAEVSAAGGQGNLYAMRAAVMAGRVPRYAEGGMVGSQGYSTGAPTYQYAAPAPAGPQILEGNLYLDSGQFMGTIRGEVSSGIALSKRQSGVIISKGRQRGK